MIEYLTLAIGLLTGLILSLFIQTKLNVTSKTYKQALTAHQELISAKDAVIRQLRGTLSTIQAGPEVGENITKLPVGEMVEVLISQISPSLPKWAKPFTGAISAWARENPEKITQIIEGLKGKAKEKLEAKPSILEPLTLG